MPEDGAVRGGELLAKVSFPLYSVQALSGRHIVVAGGGGPAKTGVANGFQIFELNFNGVQTEAEEVGWHETGQRAVMNCASFVHRSTDTEGATADSTSELLDGDHVLAVGLDDEMQLYHIRRRLVSETADGHVLPDEDKFVQTRRRRKSESLSGSQDGRPAGRQARVSFSDTPPHCATAADSDDTADCRRRIGFTVLERRAVKTDFHGVGDDSFQKVVRASRDGHLLVTGGCDGHVRVWTRHLPSTSSTSTSSTSADVFAPQQQTEASMSLHCQLDIAAHSKEVDDLDLDPAASKVVSIGKDNNCFVWSVANGRRVTQLSFNTPHVGVKYVFKKCRYGCVEGNSDRSALFTVHNPVSTSRQPAYLVLWNTKTYVPQRSVDCAGSLSALAVSDDGRYLSVGSMESGDVCLYIAFSLKLVKRVERAHHMFVTGLQFLPSCDDARAVSGNSDASVVSISVDNQVKIHHVPQPGTISVFSASILVVVVMVTTFVICSMLGI